MVYTIITAVEAANITNDIPKKERSIAYNTQTPKKSVRLLSLLDTRNYS